MATQTNPLLTINATVDDAKAQMLLERAPLEFGNALERASIQSLTQIQHAVQTNIAEGMFPARDTGTLYEHVFFEARPRPEFGGWVDVHPPADKYAAAVEFGAKPHMPPVDSLLGWVHRHFLIGGEMNREIRFHANVPEAEQHMFRSMRPHDKVRMVKEETHTVTRKGKQFERKTRVRTVSMQQMWKLQGAGWKLASGQNVLSGEEKQIESIAWAIAKTIAKRGTVGHGMFSQTALSAQQFVPPIFEKEIDAAVAALNEWEAQGGGGLLAPGV